MNKDIIEIQNQLKLLESDKQKLIEDVKKKIRSDINDAILFKESRNSLFSLDDKIENTSLELMSCFSDIASRGNFGEEMRKHGIKIIDIPIAIVQGDRNDHNPIRDNIISQDSNASKSVRVKNKTPVYRTSFLIEILKDLHLFINDSNNVQIAEYGSHIGERDMNYYGFYIPVLDKTILISNYKEQATYICNGNYTNKETDIDKIFLQNNEISIKFLYSDKWKEDLLYSLLPIVNNYDNNSSATKHMITIRDKGYLLGRKNIWELFDDDSVMEGPGREFLKGEPIKKAFEESFLSSGCYKEFAKSWNACLNKPYILPETFKSMRAFFIHCKADDARTLVEHGLRFKELILESKRLGRKLSLQEAKDCISGLGNKTQETIYAMFDNENTMEGPGREFLKGEPIKKAFEESFLSSKRYQQFAQSWNACLSKSHSLPETFKQMRSVFIDCTPDQSRKFVTHGLQFKGLILKSKELGRKLSLQEAEEYCNTFVENGLQVQLATRKLLWELINDHTIYSIKGNDNTELFQGTFQDAFKDIETYKFFSERWNNDSTHTIKLPTTRIVFYSLYIGGGTKNERNNLPKSPSNMRSLIVSPDELASKKGNKRTLDEAKQQMKYYKEKKK